VLGNSDILNILEQNQILAMKKIYVLLCLSLWLTLPVLAQTSWTQAQADKKCELIVHYLDNFPFAYTNADGELTGIEVDIVGQFSLWLKKVKGFSDVKVVYMPYTDFAKVYETTRDGKGAHIGLASVTITKERQQEVSFSAPYLKNSSLLISNTEIPSLRQYDDIPKTFAEMTAVVNRGTVLEKQLMEIKKKHYPTMRVTYADRPADVVKMVAESKSKYFGYVDLLTYWAYLKQQPANLKIHRIATLDQQRFAFVLPKGSDWEQAFAEFFESGFGFTATEAYADILQKHLGYEVVKSVELY